MKKEGLCEGTEDSGLSALSSGAVKGTFAARVLDAAVIGCEIVGSCKRPWAWTSEDGRSWPMPCGKCLACRIRRRSVWAIRMLHEISSHDESAFITLTYSAENLPLRGSDSRGILIKSDLQNFFKRYRKYLNGKEIKYYACGEYGDEGDRPHYHAILFGDNPDEEMLREVWGLGHVDVDVAEVGSIRYVAGYVSKKLGLSDYSQSNRPAPFQLSSQGIGLAWARENMIEVLMEACLTFQGKKLPVPRAYVREYEDLFPEAVDGFNARRSLMTDLALTDRILELAPLLGGKSWSELDDADRVNLLIQLQKRGERLNEELMAKERMRQYKL